MTAVLPAELLSLICRFAGRDELKALRLTNHAFAVPATELLFRQIHISPNSYSFDRAHDVVASQKISKYVKSLVYHFGMLGDYYAGFDAFKHEYFAARKPGEKRDLSEVTAEVLWCYNCWLEEIDAQRTFELRDEREELQRLCAGLPNLEIVKTLLDDIDSLDDPQDYIGKRTGMFAAEDHGEARFAKTFDATVSRSLRDISARSIQWLDLLEMVEALGLNVSHTHGDSFRKANYRNEALEQSQLLDKYYIGLRDASAWHRLEESSLWSRLQRLRFLELGIYNPVNEQAVDEDGYVRDHTNALDVILYASSNLEVLKLDFDELPFECHYEPMLPISSTICRHFWQNLRELKLEAICVTENVLLEFFRQHTASLKILQLGDVELTQLDDTDQKPNLLRLFRGMKDTLNLTSCTITGNFTNRVDQSWYVDTEVEQAGCFRDQLQNFLCSTRNTETYRDIATWPFLIDVTSSQESHTFHEFDQLCDDSWYWCPELLGADGSEISSETSDIPQFFHHGED